MKFKVIHCSNSVVHYFETILRAKMYALVHHGESKVIDCQTGEIIYNLCAKDRREKK